MKSYDEKRINNIEKKLDLIIEWIDETIKGDSRLSLKYFIDDALLNNSALGGKNE